MKASGASGGKVSIISNEEILCSPIDGVMSRLETSQSGLASREAAGRLELYGHNEVVKRRRRAAAVEFILHFNSPLILILIGAGTIAGFLGDITSFALITSIVMVSVVLDFLQEHRAEDVAEKLGERIATTATVMRDGAEQEIRMSKIVPGDIVHLSAGDVVPADSRVVMAKDFFVDQAALTGESFPVEKAAGQLDRKDVPTATGWSNYIFMGTSVVSGTAVALVVKTGSTTEYGEIAKKAAEKRPKTEFERGMKSFGSLIMQITFVLVIFVFLVNALYRRGVLESLIFSVALAVGLTPELLPMIISVNLSRGAMDMSKKGAIVKRLASIQNFGSMDVLCTDKTGTLTENRVTLVLHVDIEGKDNEKVLAYSYVNSSFQTGMRSPLDEAILRQKVDSKGYEKLDEIPFDFLRKRVSVVVGHGGERLLITKGAPEEISRVCTHYELGGKVSPITQGTKDKGRQKYNELSAQGFRVLGISYRTVSERKEVHSIGDERDMVFLGFVAFMDPPKDSAKESLRMVKEAGIELKVLTGDNDIVTRKVCEELGFAVKGVVMGPDIEKMGNEALQRVVEGTNVFARVTPVQKDRIINALKRNGHTVGLLGDGINDTPSMKESDVSISVSNAVDVAKESADIILLHKDLRILHDGVLEGRKTFGNTMKYVMMGLSSNFGNMFSVAGASLFLPFLPMLPTQILLNNLLYDFSQSAIPTDNVDREYTRVPKRMDVSFIKRFMLFFGPVSSIFDFLMFYVLLSVFKAGEPLFQTAWFIESLLTQALVIFLIRTRKAFFKSRPGRLLVISTFAVLAVALALPFTPVGTYFKFTPLPADVLGVIALFVAAYLVLVEVLKRFFYSRVYEGNERDTQTGATGH